MPLMAINNDDSNVNDEDDADCVDDCQDNDGANDDVMLVVMIIQMDGEMTTKIQNMTVL